MRSERGSAGGVVIGTAVILVGLVIFATIAPHSAHKVLSSHFIDWLQHIGTHVRHWVHNNT